MHASDEQKRSSSHDLVGVHTIKAELTVGYSAFLLNIEQPITGHLRELFHLAEVPENATILPLAEAMQIIILPVHAVGAELAQNKALPRKVIVASDLKAGLEDGTDLFDAHYDLISFDVGLNLV